MEGGEREGGRERERRIGRGGEGEREWGREGEREWGRERGGREGEREEITHYKLFFTTRRPFLVLSY